ncbi:DNA translocase FtsK 4TM domain-containing protein [Neiella sp. HB171785]|uniref:DNA translocase FtsK n=1 Tax=Neiella litorisoli TaxID=2771431 RepID=A0A8J6UF81_9GAMM|nr:DNA translocase FtsK 4TM domain-containing protein [Neiella litorisoli]MBD1388546.1 DNA translocase FtsK 4TM domain-containing protein [Neiella litorisoli]
MSGLQRLFEAGLIIFSVAALFILIALMTFHPGDPGWSQTSFHGAIHNAAGPAGAWIADFLLFVFGWVGYIAPLLTALLGWALFNHRYVLSQLDYLSLSLRLIGGLSLMLGLTGISSINFDDLYYYSSGGLVGDLIAQGLLPIVGVGGSQLLLMALIVLGMNLLTGVSLIWLAEKIGQGVFWLLTGLTDLPAWWAQRQQQTAEPEAATASVEAPQHNEVAESPQVAESQPEQEPEKAAPMSQLLKDLIGNDKSEPSQPERIEPSLDGQIDDDEPPFELDAEPQTTNANKANSKKASAELDDDKDYLIEDGTVYLKSDLVDEPPVAPMPTLELLEKPDKNKNPITQEELDAVARLVEVKLLDFNIEAKVVAVYPGPVVTRFELDLAPGIKVAKLTSLSKDLARSLSAVSVRVVEVIPGKTYVGIEIPNKKREVVRLSEVITAKKFEESKSPLAMVLGADISGQPVVVDLARMPHLLVAGTTGSGKSVGVNVMIVSLLYKSSPEDVRFIMIDPKMLELSVYEGIPHLLAEVVTDMKEAANALRWCVGEMERRYKLMSAVGVRNLDGFNAKVREAKASGQPLFDPLFKETEQFASEPPELEPLPRIVVIVDEFADMMMIVGKKVEELIARIAQKARAAGIHLVLATQRPSVDVITGLIKANIPTRMAFQVSSRVDSRTILDEQGAETLLGMGDMLYLPPGSPTPTRVHGAFVDDHEVHAVVDDWKKRGKPNYISEILAGEIADDVVIPGEKAGNEEDYDPLYDEAVAFVCESRRGSISSVQRKLKIGYNRAARIIEQMEADGIVSPPGHNGNRDVLAPPPVKDL